MFIGELDNVKVDFKLVYMQYMVRTQWSYSSPRSQYADAIPDPNVQLVCEVEEGTAN